MDNNRLDLPGMSYLICRYATSIEINVEKKDHRIWNNRFDRVP